ncbi:MAG: tetratricopeptide repeat protein, partial [Desulfuromonadales bacterium]|nr:tetratricopeptide repeat protein [Desulfuromonadales bacterium]
HQRGQRAEADELLQAGLELAPRHPPFLKGRARLLVEGGAWPQARELLSRHPAPLPATAPEYSALLAAICQQLGDWPAAVDLYHRLLAVHPNQGTWWVGLAIAQEGEGTPTEAAHSYRRGLEVGNLPQELAQYAQKRLNSGL